MVGERTVMQESLFYGFSLEQHVPKDHMLRSIDRFVDLDGIREHLRPQARQTYPDADASDARLSRAKPLDPIQRQRPLLSKADFINGLDRMQPFPIVGYK